MKRRGLAPARSLADIAKILFVLSLLLAFGFRRAVSESKDQFPWLGGALFALIVLSGAFALVATVVARQRMRPTAEKETDS